MRSKAALAVVFTLTASVSSMLLFVVQPLVARLFLPELGGSPAVWNTAMVFFQGALLVGYLIAHGARRLPARWRAVPILTLLVVGVVSLPIALPADRVPPDDGQVTWLLASLVLTVGAPFLALTTLSPTLQAWFAGTDHPRAAEPYFLYAAGNAGSLLALLAYPFVVEPLLGLRAQGRWWAAGYLTLVVLVVACALLARQSVSRAATLATPSPGSSNVRWRDRLTWLMLSAVPSGLLLAVTQFLGTDVASMPLLWVLPLIGYLLTFVIAFGRVDRGLPDWMTLLALAATAVLAGFRLVRPGAFGVAIIVAVASFTMVALWFHLALAARRPATGALTEFFLWLSIGGFLGGVFVALVAPVVFSRLLEYPLLLLVSVVIIVAITGSGRSLPSFVRFGATGALGALAAVLVLARADGVVGVVLVLVCVAAVWVVGARSALAVAPMLVVLVAVPWVLESTDVIHRDRSFFGAFKVTAVDGRHVFSHGTTIHGAQEWDPTTLEPLTYYARDTGIGRLMTSLASDRSTLAIGVVGLGVGTLAAYTRSTDSIRFFEIDPDVERIARDPRFFTFLESAQTPVEVTIGDGRRELARTDERFDILILDAFSSDSIPTHLLTSEAFATYVEALAPGGLLAVHITNRYLDLSGVVVGGAAAAGYSSRMLRTAVATWMAVQDPAVVQGSAVSGELERWVAMDGDGQAWTDDRINLIATLRW